MLRFMLETGGIVSVNPNYVISVEETVLIKDKPKTEMIGSSGDVQIAVIMLISGKMFTVLDPQRSVTRQIDMASRDSSCIGEH